MDEQLVGRTIDGRYRIEKWLGGGSMGDVYLASEIADSTPVRRVAVKILKPGKPSDAFHGEHFNDCTFPARILDSSADYEEKMHFAQIYRWGYTFVEGGERTFIAMEYIPDAESLRETIARDRASGFYPAVDRIEDLMSQLFSGLALAHRNKVMHRDLKPENLMISRGILRIVDFGLGIELSDGNLLAGGRAGTVPYMAPESLYGYFSLSSDVYSAGLVLYELWTNYNPFEMTFGLSDASASESIASCYAARKAWRYRKGKNVARQVSGSEKIDAILRKCIEFNMADRYGSACEVLDDIRKPETDEAYSAGMQHYRDGDWEKAAERLGECCGRYRRGDSKKLDILEALGFAMIRLGRQKEAAPALAEAYELDEAYQLLFHQRERRDRLLQALAQCYEDMGFKVQARIYRNKIGTCSGQGK